MPLYREFLFDDGNLAELDRHNIAFEDVVAVLHGDPRFFRNSRGRAGTRLMVGPDSSGRILAVPIIETPLEGVWRPITAWPASEAQKTRWRQAK
jgi:uncharacterized DUF497 family protein